MSKENNIDKLFRNSLKNQEFAFDGNSWGEMESMLNARSKRKAWIRTGVISTSLLFILSSASLWYFNTPAEFIQNKNFSQATQLESNQSPDLKTASNSINLKQNKTQSLAIKQDVVSLKNENSSIIKTGLLADKTNASQSKKLNQIRINKIVNKGFVGRASEDQFQLLNTQINKTKTQIKLVAKEAPVKTEYNDFESEQDYLDLASSETDPVESELIINKRHGLAVLIGNTFNYGFSNNSGIFGNNLLNNIGVEYSYQLNDKIVLGSGLFYKSKTGNGLSLDFHEEKYGFGKTVTQTNIEVNSFHYLEIPLYADFVFNQKHHVNGGVSFGYLMGVRNTITENTTETLAGTENETSTQWGMKDDFQSVDIGLKLGYEYEVSKKLKAGINAQFGLMDVTNNDTWNNSEKFHNQELQITLKYKFLQF